MTETNDCEYGPLLSLLHDGELPAERGREVMGHVRTCRACAAELEALRRMTGVFSAATFPPAPPSLKRLKPRPAGPRRWGMRRGAQPPVGEAAEATDGAYREPRHLRIVRVLTAIAAVVFLVAVGGLLLQQLRQRTIKPVPGGPKWEQVGEEGGRPQTGPARPQPANFGGKD